MNRLDFEKKYLGNCVRVVLFDGDVYIGYLLKTGTEELKNNPNLYYVKNYYYIGDAFGNDKYLTVFRKSHITSIKLY